MPSLRWRCKSTFPSHTTKTATVKCLPVHSASTYSGYYTLPLLRPTRREARLQLRPDVRRRVLQAPRPTTRVRSIVAVTQLHRSFSRPVGNSWIWWIEITPGLRVGRRSRSACYTRGVVPGQLRLVFGGRRIGTAWLVQPGYIGGHWRGTGSHRRRKEPNVRNCGSGEAARVSR
jgi:hypothetical protein